MREESELRETKMREAMAAQHQQIIQQQAFMAALSQQVQALSSASGKTSLPPLPPLPTLPALSFGMVTILAKFHSFILFVPYQVLCSIFTMLCRLFIHRLDPTMSDKLVCMKAR